MLLQLKKMPDRRRCKLYILLLVCTSAIALMYYKVFYEQWSTRIRKPMLLPTSVYAPSNERKWPTMTDQSTRSNEKIADKWNNTSSDFQEYRFDFDGDIVLVLLHMQKTGGTTFERQLVHNLVNSPCRCYTDRKRCDCDTKSGNLWLFSRYSTGWACGLHADWTELKSCVNDTFFNKKEHKIRKRRYLYITLLRSPLQRYISEWKHVRRGSTWYSTRLFCNGRPATLEEVPFCFNGENWRSVELSEFLACPHNLAADRQTRMLANLSLVGCYDATVMSVAHRRATLLDSARRNLRAMPFFGLIEYQRESQYLFERTFPPLRFVSPFVQSTRTHASDVHLTSAERAQVGVRNALDTQLYMFAHELFLRRLETARARDPGWHGMDLRALGGGAAPPLGEADYEEDEEGGEERADGGRKAAG